MKPTVHYYGVASSSEPSLEGSLSVNPNAEMDRPDFRWMLAGQLMPEYDNAVSLLGEWGWKPCRTVDALVSTKILPFLYQYNRVSSYSSGKQVESKYPGLFWAAKIHETDPITRYRIEAMIIGGAETKDVADALRVPENYLWWYERCFFEVRDRLNDPAWVDNKIFVASLRDCPHQLYRQGILWKIIAYVFKWEVFAANSSSLAPTAESVNDVVHDMITARNYENALLVSLTRPINRFSHNAIMEENLRAQEIKLRQVSMDRDNDMTDEQKTFASMMAPILAAYTEVVGREDMRAVAVTQEGMSDLFTVREHERLLRNTAEKKAEETTKFSDEGYE